MKLRLLVLLLGGALCATPTLAKTARKVAKAQPKVVLQWPRISRANQDDYWERISDLQGLLNARGANLKIDGNFGPQTEAAVKQFQQSHKLNADGIVGPQTWDKLVIRLKRGDKGPAVEALQDTMIGHSGEYIDEFKKETGKFGFETETAVRNYQKSGGIKVDGVAGPQTWCILFQGKVKK